MEAKKYLITSYTNVCISILIRTRKNTQLAKLEKWVIGQSRKEIEKCALMPILCRNAQLLLMRTLRQKRQKVILPFNPIGVIFGGNAMELSILSSYSFAIPALMGGNTGVLKHASMFKDVLLQSRMLSLRQDFLKECYDLNVESRG
jgi:succinate-semialdehyde dehydrogenase/glutarate-semialdehyde dehydrogenase